MKGQIPYVNNNYDNMVEQNTTVPFYNDTNLAVSEESVPDYNTGSSKAKIIPFPKKNIESITLQEWLSKYHLQDELQSFFINMDIAMKYIHDQGYYIKSFALDSIELLNNSIKQVKFDEVEEMPLNFSQQKELVHNNVFLSAVLQIGVYAKCLQYFTDETMQFLKENFDQFAIFLPEEDVPYYKGIVERGATVYYSEYVGQRKIRDLKNLETQFENDGGGKDTGKSLVKKTGNYTAEDLVPQNTHENEMIYANLAKKDAAFARALIYPVLILLFGLILLLLCYLFV